MTYRGLLCDLDGVVYRGAQPCPGAVEGLAQARTEGVQLLFMTNNASRTPETVAEQMVSLGVAATPDEVLTASQVAATVLATDHPELGEDGLPVLAVGGPGLTAALREVGLEPLSAVQVGAAAAGASPVEVAAVVQGYGADVAVLDLTEAAYAIRAGATWIATNDDATLPTVRGLAPGNGSLVAAVTRATGQRPLVVGKPHTPAYDVALERLRLPREECLMIGDRLDTDIAGARAAGIASALVLTGVSTEQEALTAPPEHRPDHIAPTIPDLSYLWSGR